MTNKLVLASVDDIEKSVDVEVGPTDWLSIEQDRVDGFADATLDHQWIHIDAERAKDGPFGGTIAHGFLTLSLLPHFNNELREMRNVAMGVNYGLNKVRFPNPVPVGGRLRARATVVECSRLDEQSAQLVTRMTIELEGAEKPACIADLVTRIYFTS